uniref:Uncharacterized protein n=1 Tax=Avena sativa TaxID=4498 RepID=A0ACD5XJS4_AVESA
MDPAEGRRVMVAVDEGDESARALRWCLANFAARGDTIVLLYVRAPAPPTYSVLDATGPVGYMFAGEATAAVEGYSRQVADAVVEKAKKLCALHGKDKGEMKVEAKVSVGDARTVICDMVDKLGADVLVMGSHGYGLFKRALLGSVSDYCVRNANCPVLIVKS